MPPTPEPNIEFATEQAPSITREVTIDAPLEDVWEAVSTDAGREQWLEDDPERELVIEETTPHEHITWWWWRDDEPARRVDVHISPVPAGTRVIVTETEPIIFPLARLASAAAGVSQLLVCA